MVYVKLDLMVSGGCRSCSAFADIENPGIRRMEIPVLLSALGHLKSPDESY